MKVIGFSAKMQGGKTTSTNAVIAHFCGLEYNYRIHEISFARFLKEIVAKCFFGEPVFEENMKKALVSGKTGREWLQIVGTDWFRAAHPTCWVNAAEAEIVGILGHSIDEELDLPERPDTDAIIKASGAVEDLFVVSDVRFPNELKFVQYIGGHVIRLLRNPQPDCTHESETALDEIADMTLWATTHDFGEGMLLFDTVFDNGNITVENKNEMVIQGIIENGWA